MGRTLAAGAVAVGVSLAVALAGCAAEPGNRAAPPDRASGEEVAAGDTAGTLLLRGRIGAREATLEPAFLLDAQPTTPPDDPGRHRLRGLDADGAPVFSLRFDGARPAHPPGEEHFTFALPLDADQVRRLVALELLTADGRRVERRSDATAEALQASLERGDAVRADRLPDSRVRLRWDAARYPGLMVRDPDTRAVLTFGQAGEAIVHTALTALEIVLSDGIRSGRITIQVP